jgi:hypothetical protein
MAVTVYKSTDASAPTLTGTAGSLTTLLDAVLVNGYGAKAAAGWTIAFTASNKRCYRMTVTGATGFYVRVDDTASVNTTSLGREALCRGFETMSTVDVGTGSFPTATQIANGIAVRKSATNEGTTTRSWIIVADNKSFYLFTNSGDFTGYSGFVFGDFFSLKSGDGFRAIIIGRAVNNTVLAADDTDRLQNLTGLGVVATGHFAARQWNNELAGAVNVGKHGSGAHSLTVLAGVAHYPNLQDGSLLLSQLWVHEISGGLLGVVKGRLRGFWHFLHPIGSPVNDGDTFAGTGALAGKTFLVIRPTPTGSGVYIVETSDTWETSS